jgi:hypothetical protein
MNYNKLLKDPYYSLIIFRIEKVIHELDKELLDEGVSLNDTNVKSCLQKAAGHAKGKFPSLPDSNKKEEGMKRISMALIELGSQLIQGDKVDESITKKDWIFSLKATEESLKIRKEMYGHSRGYLDFLKGFIEEGKIL